MISEQQAVQSPKIIVIEDDHDMQRFVGTVLECFDYSMFYASSGDEALSIFEKNIPDVILLDVHLPDVNGIDLLSEMTKKKILKDVPVLVMTADVSKDTVDGAYNLNIYDFIEKPISPNLLIKRVEAALARKQFNDDLTNKEKHISKIQKISGVGSWEFDSRTDKVSCSSEICSILGIADEDSTCNLHSFLALTHEADIDEVSECMRLAIKDGAPYALESRLYDSDGYETIVLHQGDVIKDENTDHYKIYGTMTDITERKNAQLLIEYNSMHDRLTGLPNRDHFCNLLSVLMLDNDKNEKLLAVVFIGIDRFKNINESLGHSIGDELLSGIKEKLITFEGVTISRFSGDVFAIAIPNMSTIDDIVYQVSEIKNVLSKPFKLLEHELYLTVSVGVSVYPLHFGGKNELIKNAESAMHFSKNSGGNRISCFDRQMVVTGRKRLFIENDLRKAIDKEQFEVFYQPQVSVQNRRLIGMEALIRWNHPEHGLIGPDDFIPIAEETGLIVPIGQWVIETATKQVAEWIAKDYGLLRVGINLSAMQFENMSLIKDVEKALSSSGLLPCSLDLEVTESSAMRNVKQTISILNKFSEMGIQTSMDDFGTGYSSLSYLKMMPLHTLKIDRAFVKDIKENGENGELARMIISMCHTLGLNVIAEGVENEGHMNFLHQHECSEAQGYLFSRPVNKFKFEEILNNYSNADVECRKPELEALIF